MKRLIEISDLILAVIAFFSAIFVAVTGGIKLTLGFRGSKETAERKKRIDNQLIKEAGDEMSKLLRIVNQMRLKKKP